MKMYKVSGKKILAVLGIVVLLGVSAGCSEVEKFSWEKLKETQYRMVTGKKPDTAKTAAEDKGQAAADTIAGSQGQQDSTAVANSREQDQKQKKVSVVLYFSDQNGDYLIAEKREVPLVPGLARATVQELIKGPEGKGLSGTIPEGTKLLDINIENGLCTVDLSKEFRDNHWGGSSGEILTVYSLVNTLTQFPTVEKVEILVEGQKIDTLAGHMDLSAPVSRNSQIINSMK